MANLMVKMNFDPDAVRRLAERLDRPGIPACLRMERPGAPERRSGAAAPSRAALGERPATR